MYKEMPPCKLLLRSPEISAWDRRRGSRRPMRTPASRTPRRLFADTGDATRFMKLFNEIPIRLFEPGIALLEKSFRLLWGQCCSQGHGAFRWGRDVNTEKLAGDQTQSPADGGRDNDLPLRAQTGGRRSHTCKISRLTFRSYAWTPGASRPVFATYSMYVP